MRSSALATCAVAPVLVACAGRAHAVDDDVHPFACRDRIVSYTATHHIDADELGVQLDCTDGPRIQRWETDRAGHRKESTHRITPGQFDHAWAQLDATGWQYLHDCKNGGGKGEPIYSFNVGDDQAKASFACQARVLPSPYNVFVDPLDQLAAQHADASSDGSDGP